MNAPLQLERYVFTKIEVEANPDFVLQESPEEDPVTMRLDVGLGEHNGDPSRYQVSVGIHELRAENGALPYRISLQIVGQFVVAQDFKPDDLRKIVQVNGASMLYSAARELVMLVTGRGPWPAFQLPTISFYKEVADSTPEKNS